MVICPKCGSEQLDDYRFCDQCGAALAGAPTEAAQPSVIAQPEPTVVALTCPNCGAQVTPGEAFCDKCSTPLGPAAPVSPPQATTPGPPPPMAAPAPEPGAMLVCPSCGVQLEPDSKFCDMCGKPIGVAAPPSQHSATPPQMPPTPPVPPGSYPATPPAYPQDYPAPQLTPVPSYPYTPPGPVYAPQSVVQGRLVVQGTNATLPFPPGKTVVVIGREDPVSNIFPDVDLTDHGGDERGISRQHARIFIQGNQMYIEDMNSTNYTYVNKQKLAPGQPHPLNSGDEIRLGGVKLNFYL